MYAENKRAWCRGWAGFALFSALIAIIVLSVAGGILFYAQKPTSDVFVVTNTQINFTCVLAYHDEHFNISADVNLTDWMDRDEAVAVANALFSDTLGYDSGILHEPVSAEMNELGVWAVKLTWGYSAMDLRHWFMAEIDPFSRTIVYSHCK